MAIYATLGVSQALGLCVMGGTFAFFTYFASQSLHKVCPLAATGCCFHTPLQDAIERVMHAPMSFFDTTVSVRPLLE